MTIRTATTEVVNLIQDFSSIIVEAIAKASSGPTGPVTKYFYQEWVKPINAPLWEAQGYDPVAAGEEYCAGVLELPNVTHAGGIEPRTVSIVDHIVAMVISAIILTILIWVVGYSIR